MKKRLTAFFLSIAMVVGLTACGGEESGTTTTGGGSDIPMANPDVVYLPEFLDMDLGGSSYIEAARMIGNELHMFYTLYEEEGAIYEILVYNIEDGTTEKITLERPEEAIQNSYVSSVVINEDGSVEVIENADKYDDDWNLISSQSFYYVNDAEGKLVSSEDATERLDVDTYGYVSQMLKDTEGNYIVSSWNMENGGSSTRVYSADWQLLGEINAGNFANAETFQQMSDGTIIASGWGETGVCVAPVDAANRTIGETIEVNKSSGSADVWCGSDNKVYYVNGTKLFSADIKTGEVFIIMDLLGMDLNADYVQNVFELGDDRYLLLYQNWSSNNGMEFIVANPTDPADVPERITLTVATMYTSQDLVDKVVEFNQTNTEYRIEIKSYVDTIDDYETALTNMQNDITAGNVPDIVVVSNGFPWQNWSKKGIFTNLYPLMETDGEFSKDDILDNVKTAMEIDGSLYVMPIGFAINTYMANANYAKDVEDLSPQNIMELESKLQPGSHVLSYEARPMLMQLMIYSNMSYYVDYTTGECNFDSEEFQAVLEWIKTKPVEYDYEAEGSIPEGMQNGTILFHDVYVSNVTDYQFNRYLFGGDVVCLGVNGKESNLFNLGDNAYAISEDCEHKEAAWQFVKMFWDKEYQTSDMFWSIPVTKEGYEHLLYSAQHMNGAHSYGWDDVEVDIVDATDEEIAEFKALVESATVPYLEDTMIRTIIEEETAPFFEGQKSAAEVSAIIQSRVEIYLKENM